MIIIIIIITFSAAIALKINVIYQYGPQFWFIRRRHHDHDHHHHHLTSKLVKTAYSREPLRRISTALSAILIGMFNGFSQSLQARCYEGLFKEEKNTPFVETVACRLSVTHSINDRTRCRIFLKFGVGVIDNKTGAQVCFL